MAHFGHTHEANHILLGSLGARFFIFRCLLLPICKPRKPEVSLAGDPDPFFPLPKDQVLYTTMASSV